MQSAIAILEWMNVYEGKCSGCGLQNWINRFTVSVRRVPLDER